MSRVAYNNFARGKTKTQDRVRRKIGLLYLSVPPELRTEPPAEQAAEPQEKQPRGKLKRVAEPPAQYGPARLEEELRSAMPTTREEAVEWVRAFFAAVRRHADDFPPGAAELEAPLLHCAEGLPPRDPPDADPGPPAKGRRKKKQ